MPYSSVCIHDGSGLDNCGGEAGAAPAQCSEMTNGWSDAIANPVGPDALPYVEVRACYQFTTLFNITDLQLPFGWNVTLGNVWLQRDRAFAAGNY